MKKVKLGDVCEKASSNFAQKDLDILEGEFPVYGASGLIKYIDIYHQDNEYIAVVKDGAGVGRTMFLPARSSVIGTLQYILPKANIMPKYLYYAMKHLHLEKYCTGATIPHIYFKDYEKEEFSLPDKEMQLRIVSILDRIEKIIEYRKQQIEELDSLAKSRFVEMFGDPIANPMEWDKRSLGKECEIITGNTPSRKVSAYYGDYIEWIKSDNINTPNAILTTAEEYLSEEGLKVGRCVDAGAILMTCIAGSLGCIGNVAIADRQVSFNQQINGIIPRRNNAWFMYVLFELSKKGIQSSINMALKGILSKGQLAEMEFIFPPIDLQNEFANFVEQVDKLKLATQKALDELQLLFDSLMQKYFG